MALPSKKYNINCLKPSYNVLGIQLGTTNTVVAVWMTGKPSPEEITIENNDKIIPSYVWCKADGTFDVGRDAARNLKQFSNDICYDAKRMIGKSFDDIYMAQHSYWSFNIINYNGRPAYQLSDDKIITPEEITTLILKKVKNVAENYVGVEVIDAVITVPSTFNQFQRHATIQAAEAAGLNVLSLESKSVAAAYALKFDYKRFDDFNILVFCFGDGALDVSVMKNYDDKFYVVANGGDCEIGGSDFDKLIMSNLMERIKIRQRKKMEENCSNNISSSVDLNNPKNKIRFQRLAEATKVALTTCDKEIVNLSDFVHDNHSNNCFFEFSTNTFETLAFPLIQKIESICLKALNDAKMEASDIDNILLIGGSSRMPIINKLLNKVFHLPPDNMFGIRRALNPDTAGAYGAAILAAQISNPNQQENKISNFLSSSIGIGLAQNQYSIALKKGSKYPTQIKKRYFTSENEQKYAIINIYEGENLEASLNQKLFSFVVRDIPLCSKNEAFIDIIFKLNKYGIITVKVQNIQKTINYRACNIVKEAGESIELFNNELKIDPKNDQEKRNLCYARAQFHQNMIVISEKMNKMYKMIKDDAIIIEDETKKEIIKNCKIINQWLKDNPDKKVEDKIIDLGKKIEKDAKNFIDLLAIS